MENKDPASNPYGYAGRITDTVPHDNYFTRRSPEIERFQIDAAQLKMAVDHLAGENVPQSSESDREPLAQTLATVLRDQVGQLKIPPTKHFKARISVISLLQEALDVAEAYDL